jgi:hypothetical protein
MFRAQPGFAGVLLSARGAERAVITLWRDMSCAEALDRSRACRATVAALESTGLLRSEGIVEVLDLEGIFLDQSAIERTSLRF